MNHLRHDLGLDQPLWERFLTFVGQHAEGRPRLLLRVPPAGLDADRRPALADAAADGNVDAHLDLAGDVARHPRRLARGQRARPERQRRLADAVVGADVLARADPAGALRQRQRWATSRRSSRRAACRRTGPPAGWRRRTSWTSPGISCCRALTLVAVIFAQYVTIMRSSIIDERGNPYLLTARAKGLRDEVVRRRHAVPNALLPSVTVIFLQIGGDDRRRDHRRDRLLVARARLPHVHRALASRTCRCSRAPSSSSAPR